MAFLCASCSTQSLYQETSEAFANSRFGWWPLDESASHDGLQDEEREQASIDFDRCIQGRIDFWNRIYPDEPRQWPNRDARMLEIVECMNDKGWKAWGTIVAITS